MKSVVRFLSAAILVLIAASCTDNGGSIYYSIQKVQKVATSVLPTDLTVADIVNTGNASAPYFIAAGGVFKGPPPASDGSIAWQRVNPPSGMLCNSLAWDGTNLWGGFFSTNGSSTGLYYALPASPNSWTQDPLAPPGQVTYLTSTAPGDLFAVIATMSGSNFVYSLWEKKGAGWTQLIPSIPSPITGVGLFSSSNTYFVTTGNTVYWNSVGADPPTFDKSSTSLLDATNQVGDTLNGIFVDNNAGHTMVIVLAKSGIYYSASGSTLGNGVGWTRATNSSNGNNIGFLCAAGPIDNYANGSVYLLGTDSNQYGAAGFYFFNLTASSFNGGTGGLTRYVNPSISLYIDAIRRILVDANNNPSGTVNNNVFFGTVNAGLWRTSVDSLGNPQSWVQE
ncbi:MAG TPA: hypothetical protein VMV03_03130 [Spirochaetia bacterium]|nr:hypothetical protein [Spirochaetia bacterium]